MLSQTNFLLIGNASTSRLIPCRFPLSSVDEFQSTPHSWLEMSSVKLVMYPFPLPPRSRCGQLWWGTTTNTSRPLPTFSNGSFWLARRMSFLISTTSPLSTSASCINFLRLVGLSAWTPIQGPRGLPFSRINEIDTRLKWPIDACIWGGIRRNRYGLHNRGWADFSREKFLVVCVWSLVTSPHLQRSSPSIDLFDGVEHTLKTNTIVRLGFRAFSLLPMLRSNISYVHHPNKLNATVHICMCIDD